MYTVRYRLMAAAALLAIGATMVRAETKPAQPAAKPTMPAQTNSKEIMARTPAQLVETLKNPGASVFEKAKACQRLAVVGTKDAVGALAALLADENLNCYARCGLEGIPDPAAAEALRAAAAKLQGRQLVGVLDSIGQRKDAQAVGLLKGLLNSGDKSVASAAAGALGRIGTTEAAAVLKESLAADSPVKNCLADGCLACADGLIAAGKKAEAVALYEAVAKADLPKQLKVAALSGQLQLQQNAAKDLLLSQIRSQEKAFFNVGLSMARQIDGVDIMAALLAELPKLSPERRAGLLLALGDRKTPPPLPPILEASKSDSPALREAAIRLLAKRGDVSTMPILLDAALSDAPGAQAAVDGLKNLPGAEVDAAIVARLAGAQPKAKVVLFELLGARRVASATPAICQSLGDADPSVRLGALAALGQLAELKDIQILAAKALAAGPKEEVDAAQAALKMAALRMSDREGCAAKLAGLLDGASPVNQAYLLEMLGKVSGQKALQTVAARVKSADPAIKDAATRVLGQWLNAEVAPALLDIVKSDPDNKYQVRALRGYIRIARQLQLPAETKLAMFRTAMDVAKRTDEKKLALEVLTRIPSAATLGLAVSYLDKPELKDKAADAAVKVAAKTITQDPKAVADAMQKVVDAKVGGDPGNRASQLLGQAKAAAK